MDGELNTCNQGEKGRQYILLYFPAHISYLCDELKEMEGILRCAQCFPSSLLMIKGL